MHDLHSSNTQRMKDLMVIDPDELFTFLLQLRMKDQMEIDPDARFTFLLQPKNEGSNGDWPWCTIYIPNNQRMMDQMVIDPGELFTFLLQMTKEWRT